MTQETRTPSTGNEPPKLLIDKGVQITGTIKFAAEEKDVAFIRGDFEGNIEWNGRVVIAEGATVNVMEHASCRELTVAGTLRAAESAKTSVGLLHIRPSGLVDVSELTLPKGGLEQARGSVLNANLRMVTDHPYAALQPAAPATSAKPQLVAVSGEGQGEDHQREAAAAPFATGTAG